MKNDSNADTPTIIYLTAKIMCTYGEFYWMHLYDRHDNV